MDFNDTPEEAAFRADVRAWLDANMADAWPEGDGGEAPLSEDVMIRAHKAWQAKKFDAGYAAITWPEELGGRGGTAMQQLIYQQEESRQHMPGSIFAIGLGMCIPVVNAFGTPEQKARHVRKGLRGEDVWCQLFSEPSGGSDVASARTTARRVDGGWSVTGQKIWTSGAQHCDFGLLLARTDTKVPKHKGLTMFIVNMKAPGVTVRPVRQMTGQAEFNEVFFDDVHIPDSDRIAAEGDGWKVAVATLMFERHSVGGGLGFTDYDGILELARKVPLDGQPALRDGRVRERIVDMYLNTRGLQLLAYRAQTAMSRGETPGPEQSITKAVSAAQGQQGSYLAMDLMDHAGVLTSSELGRDWGTVEYSWTWGAAMRIAGGTDEILRNIIAERVLGLPGDIRVDKDIPYDQLSA